MNTYFDYEEAERCFKKNGVAGLAQFCKANLERWKDVEINIGITGNSGVGNSSFINAIRGLGSQDPGAATIGVTETTTKPTVYLHPTNEKIKFWDLPGIGTRNFPDFETYCRKVEMEKYDFFLILSMKRFYQNDRLLAERMKSLNKSFFFVRTNIDSDTEKQKESFDQENMLQTIRKDCWENLKDLEMRRVKVFLISNKHSEKWDFGRLKQAILDDLPSLQKECLTFLLTTCSMDMLKRKVDLLRGKNGNAGLKQQRRED